MKALKHKWINVGHDPEKTALEASWRQQTLILNATQLRAAEKERTELAKLVKMLPEGPLKQNTQTRLRAIQLSLCSAEAQAIREIELLLKVKARDPDQEEQLQKAERILAVYTCTEPEKTNWQLFIEKIKNIVKGK